MLAQVLLFDGSDPVDVVAAVLARTLEDGEPVTASSVTAGPGLGSHRLSRDTA